MNLTGQLVVFFLIGCLQFVADTLALVLLTKAGLAIALANPLSRALAAVLGLGLNHAITFRKKESRLSAATVGRFVVLWIAMTLASTLALALLYDLRPSGVAEASWIAMTKIGVETALFFASFYISRQWVYQAPSAPRPPR